MLPSAKYRSVKRNIKNVPRIEIAEKAIEKTVEFFHKMGMKTKISENAENIEKTADFIVNRFEERGWKAMGEKQNITLEKVRAIVEMSY